MCYSFNDAANRAAFLADEQAYCEGFGLTGPQRAEVAARDAPQAMVMRNYHVPISNTAAATVVLEPA